MITERRVSSARGPNENTTPATFEDFALKLARAYQGE